MDQSEGEERETEDKRERKEKPYNYKYKGDIDWDLFENSFLCPKNPKTGTRIRLIYNQSSIYLIYIYIFLSNNSININKKIIFILFYSIKII